MYFLRRQVTRCNYWNDWFVMRTDSLGLFWEDRPPPPKEKKEKPKCRPPEPVWLKPDYLPGLQEAKRFPVALMSNEELYQAVTLKDPLLFDIEVYPNYFLASFRSFNTGKVIYFEAIDKIEFDIEKLRWILESGFTVGFNSLNYDLPITALALAKKPIALLKRATDQIILEKWRPSDIFKQYKTKAIKGDHIDLIELTHLRANLKISGGRLHVPRMQDLPFPPDTVLTTDQITCVRWYNINSDLTNTAFIYQALQEQIALRTALSNEYEVDLRSKSDAQIAETVISKELTRLTGQRITRPVIDIGTVYRYNVPYFLQYKSAMMNAALNIVRNAHFIVDESGSIAMPKEIGELKLSINNSVYRMGIGGLHSSETTISHHTDDEYILIDKDMTSYYPFIILNLGLYPQHLGTAFLDVYLSIVNRRITAKQQKNKVVADSLKITINGNFGKLGSKYSIFYSPDLLIQVTLTGQLTLLMLIERLELAGINVVSANTDGIVIKCHRSKQETLNKIVEQFEQDTRFKTEETLYKAVYSRDVNNYIAFKTDGSVKTKGAYSNPWNDNNGSEKLKKNPTNIICIEAVQQYLADGTPLMATISQCADIRKFVTVRAVKGGAVKVWEPGRAEYLGKSIRWYYAKDVTGDIVYALNGNKVPRSDGAKPLMDLPDSFPQDVDYEWYLQECEKILQEIGFIV